MENSLFFFYIIVTNTFVFCDESTFVCINVHAINSQIVVKNTEKLLCPSSKVWH